MGARLAGLLIKEWIQFLRDRVILILILWLYTVEVIICTLALSFEVENMPLAVADLDRTPASRELVDRFLASNAFAATGYPTSADEVADWLQSGRSRVGLIIPVGFQQGLVRGEPTNVQVVVDGTNSKVAAQARGYATAIISRFRASASAAGMPDGGVAVPVLRVWYNQ
ncbi:MAG TPA: ABC transporter permease, partial [Hyphomicrobiales bacterium]|nr:ABC transporter permease [Hyphomicrobiales bacterium]